MASRRGNSINKFPQISTIPFLIWPMIPDHDPFSIGSPIVPPSSTKVVLKKRHYHYIKLYKCLLMLNLFFVAN